MNNDIQIKYNHYNYKFEICLILKSSFVHYQYLQKFFETKHRRDRNDQNILIFKEKIVLSILLKFNLTLMNAPIY